MNIKKAMNDAQDPSGYIAPEMMKAFLSEMQVYRAALKEV